MADEAISLFHNDRHWRVSHQVLFGAPFMFCQTKTREQASVRYLLRTGEYEKLQSQMSTQLTLWIELLSLRRLFPKPPHQSLFPLKSEAVGKWQLMWDALLTWRAALPRCPSRPSSPICSLGLRAKCQPALMQTQRTMGTQSRNWQGTAGEVAAKEGSL